MHIFFFKMARNFDPYPLLSVTLDEDYLLSDVQQTQSAKELDQLGDSSPYPSPPCFLLLRSPSTEICLPH